MSTVSIQPLHRSIYVTPTLPSMHRVAPTTKRPFNMGPSQSSREYIYTEMVPSNIPSMRRVLPWFTVVVISRMPCPYAHPPIRLPRRDDPPDEPPGFPSRLRRDCSAALKSLMANSKGSPSSKWCAGREKLYLPPR